MQASPGTQSSLPLQASGVVVPSAQEIAASKIGIGIRRIPATPDIRSHTLL
jgi:hypothetical protein